MSVEDPKSRLFLSADIAGSTQYKQSVQNWPVVFLEFYWSFAQRLVEAQTEVRPRQTLCAEGVKFTLWKAVGDELIYEVDVRKEADISLAVRVWLRAMELCEKETLGRVGLALKGGAFLATFPAPDSISTIPREFGDRAEGTLGRSTGVITQHDLALQSGDKDQYLIDYFGPSIDTGFRVFSEATKRYFTLSVDVAWAMAALAEKVRADGVRDHADKSMRSGADSNPEPEAPFVHRFDDAVYMGGRVLKGVWNGRAYPLVGVDRLHKDPLQNTMDILDRSQREHDSVQAAAVASLGFQLNSERTWPFHPYLPDSENEEFRRLPEKGPLAEARHQEAGGAGYEDPIPPEDPAPEVPQFLRELDLGGPDSPGQAEKISTRS